MLGCRRGRRRVMVGMEGGRGIERLSDLILCVCIVWFEDGWKRIGMGWDGGFELGSDVVYDTPEDRRGFVRVVDTVKSKEQGLYSESADFPTPVFPQ